jgi:hypothetical protein
LNLITGEVSLDRFNMRNTKVIPNSSCVSHQGCEDGVQDLEGEEEGVQQTRRQVLRQHVCEMEEAGAHGQGAREAGTSAHGRRQHGIRSEL